MEDSWFYLAHLHGGSFPLRYPLAYPDPDGEFFGYERNGLKTLQGWNRPGTKALVGGVTLAASTLVGIRTGVAIVRSVDSVTAYQVKISDASAPWIVVLYRQAKQHWSYLIPPDPAERRVLRDVCARTLALRITTFWPVATIWRQNSSGRILSGAAWRPTASRKRIFADHATEPREQDN